MNLVYFIVGLFGGILILLGGLIYAAAHIAVLSNDDFRELRRIARTRQFGVISVMVFMTIVGLAMVLLRLSGIPLEGAVPDDPFAAGFVGIFMGFCLGAALVLSGVLVGVGLMLAAGWLERAEVRKTKELLRRMPDTFQLPQERLATREDSASDNQTTT